MDHETSTIDLQDLFLVIRRHIILIILFTITIAALVGVYSEYGISKKYESKTLFSVSKNSYEDTNSSDIFRFGSELAKRYSIVAKSGPVIQAIQTDLIETYNLDISEGKISNSFTVVSVDETDILRVTATYTDAATAQNIADSVTKVSMEKFPQVYDDAKVSLISQASSNTNPVSPNIRLNIVIGFVLGLMVSVGFVLMKEFLNRKIKTEKDVEQYLNIPHFGTIPDLKHVKND